MKRWIVILTIVAAWACSGVGESTPPAPETPTITDSGAEASRFEAVISFGIKGPVESITECGVSYGLNGVFSETAGSLEKETGLCTVIIKNLYPGTTYSYRCFIGNGRNRLYSEEKTFSTESYGGDNSRSYDEVILTAAGTLQAILEQAGLDAGQVVNLRISGPVNDDDFVFMRDMMTVLEAVDMENCTTEDNRIPKKAFTGKRSLKSFVFPKSTEKIGGLAFQNTNLSGKLILPAGLKEIENSKSEWSNGPGAFGCTLITDIEFPPGLEIIGDGAFCGCRGLAVQFKLPEGVKRIGVAAFTSCSFSGKLELPSSIEILEYECFRESGKYQGGLVIPPLIKEIPAECFYGCEYQGTLDLGSCTSIGDDAFLFNQFSGALVVPEGVTEIPRQCFSNNSFTSISLPSTLTRIMSSAFAFRVELESVSCKAHNPPMVLYDSAFGSDKQRSHCVLEVPESSLDLYKEAPYWKDHFLEIKACAN